MAVVVVVVVVVKWLYSQRQVGEKQVIEMTSGELLHYMKIETPTVKDDHFLSVKVYEWMK